jgi:hypothetical protein
MDYFHVGVSHATARLSRTTHVAGNRDLSA